MAMQHAQLRDQLASRALASDRLAARRQAVEIPPEGEMDGEEGVEEEESNDLDEQRSESQRRRRFQAVMLVAYRRLRQRQVAELLRQPISIPIEQDENSESEVMKVARQFLIRLLNSIGAGTLVGIIVPFVLMHLQLLCGNILGMKAIPPLSIGEKILLGLMDMLVLAALLTIFAILGIIIVGLINPTFLIEIGVSLF